jgi:cell division protein FtsB
MRDTKDRDESALEEKLSESEISRMNDRNFEKAVKHGLTAPISKVLLRTLLAVLIISAIGMFITGIMKYNEYQREIELLEAKKDALNDEIDYLEYLIESPVDYDYIVRVAREKLGLHMPDEIVYYTDINK